MAEDFYSSNSLNSYQMAILAQRYRTKFDIAQADTVDIINILEFKVPQIFPEFNLIIVPDDQLDDYANTNFDPICIIVRQSVYDNAAKGDKFSRLILAHELGHLLLHSEHVNRSPASSSRHYSENIKELNGLESAEAQATSFGRAFLAPPQVALKYVNDAKKLSEVAGIPYQQAVSAIRIAKRPELHNFGK